MSAPFMQLYVADYLGDTRHLTTEQHGAYLLLLMTMWRSDGRLPNDTKKLARITGCTPSRWSKISVDVLAYFAVDGDDLVNERLMFELEKASEKSIKRAEAGSKGGSAKALKTHKTDVAIASELPQHSSEPEPEDISEAKASSIVRRSARPTALDKPNGFARFWEAYPNKVAKPAAEKAYAKACREIDDPDPPAVLLEGLERAKRCRQWVDGYIPHPTTWLNQGRWADQPAEIPTQKANPHDRPRQNPGNDREARRGVWAEVLAEERGEGIGDLARAG